MMGKVGAVVVGSILVLLAFTPAAWPSAQGGPVPPPGPGLPPPLSELEAAIDHAELAQAAETVRVARHHLQHVINCLEGSSGADYRNPGAPEITSCSKEISSVPSPNPGIIPGLQGRRVNGVQGRVNAIDLEGARRNAQAALDAALAGLRKSDINGAHAAAALVLRYLQAARAAIG